MDLGLFTSSWASVSHRSCKKARLALAFVDALLDVRFLGRAGLERDR